MQITLQELNMTYPNGKKALQGVSASLDSPSLIGLLGPNGAGKSTLMKLLVAGLLPTGGTIRADGEPLTKCERAYKARLGYLPQDFGLFDELTVEQFLDYMGGAEGAAERPGEHSGGDRGRPSGGEAAGQNPHPLRRPAPAGGHCPGPAGRSGVFDL